MKILITGGSGFIGTNFIDTVFDKYDTIYNLDIVPPKKEAHKDFWNKIDLLDLQSLTNFFLDKKPNIVVHFAAETNCDPDLSLQDYKLNTEGTENLVKAIKVCGSVEHFVFTSTQYVFQKKGELPRNDLDFYPHTVYGESKIINEKYIREHCKDLTWTIIRPTNVWGPWHLRYQHEFWKVLKEGKYFHPGKNEVSRAYGYVKNICFQINKIFGAPKSQVDKQVFYVGDKNINLYDWTNEFSKRLTGKKVRVLPRFIVFMIACTGECLRLFRIKFPLTISRYNNMVSNEIEVTDKTFELFGPTPHTLKEGVDETVDWLISEDAEFWGGGVK